MHKSTKPLLPHLSYSFNKPSFRNPSFSSKFIEAVFPGITKASILFSSRRLNPKSIIAPNASVIIPWRQDVRASSYPIDAHLFQEWNP